MADTAFLAVTGTSVGGCHKNIGVKVGISIILANLPYLCLLSGNTKGGTITVLLTSCLTGLD